MKINLPLISCTSMTPGGKHLANLSASSPSTVFVSVISGNNLYDAVAASSKRYIHTIKYQLQMLHICSIETKSGLGLSFVPSTCTSVED